MQIQLILRVLGAINLFMGVMMLAPGITALIYQDGDAAPIFEAAGLTVGVSLALVLLTQRQRFSDIHHREGFAVVALGWLSGCFFGALPFYFSGDFGPFVNCYFESVSAFTTTGASILTDIESQHRGLLLWRSMMQWLGGLGIVLMSVAILPFLGVGGLQLYKAEVPGPTADKLAPRITETARDLWRVYLIISAAELLLLWLGDMSFYDALCHTFATTSTGGFSTRNASVGAYNSAYIDGVITVFMLVAGLNFGMHFRALGGDFRGYLRSAEVRAYAGIFAFGVLLVMTPLWISGDFGPLGALRYASFQVASLLTGTGFATTDYAAWVQYTPAIPTLFFFFLFFGGMAGSTTGGVKIVRLLLLVRLAKRELYRLVHPRAVVKVKLDRASVGDGILQAVTIFCGLYFVIFAVGAVLLAIFGVDPVTAASASAACLGNVGPGFGAVGPAGNFAEIPVAGKWLCSALMLLGRLEIYTLLILLSPEFWRR